MDFAPVFNVDWFAAAFMVFHINKGRVALGFFFYLCWKKLSSRLGEPVHYKVQRGLKTRRIIQIDGNINLMSDWDNGAPQQPSKIDIRYSVRYKRADAKRALNDLLAGKVSSQHFQDEDSYQRASNSGRSKARKSCSGKGKQNKRWQKVKLFSDEDEHKHPEMTFSANFGGQQYFTWSFNTWKDSNCHNSAAGFQWKDDTKSEKYKGRIWSESDLEDDVNDEGLHSDRIALGLPASGPLSLDDVKRAFHEFALKWHPDKHHGLAQAVAAEKFKLCVDAYKNLCSALKSS